MGILNVTPDSFHDGGRHDSFPLALAHGLQLHRDGAGLLDVGGESTRPGADPVSVQTELDRVVPVVEALVARGVPVSIDTRRPEVAQAALEAGACAVNDVEGLRDPRMIELCRLHGAGACAMHMRGTPATMQSDTAYGDLVAEVGAFLGEVSRRWCEAGLDPSLLALDPGVGFGKSTDQNPALVAATGGLRDSLPGHPWYLGLSRKSWIRPLAAEGSDRLAGSLGGALAALARGCDVLRVHDVAQTLEAARAFLACGGVR